MAAASDHSFEMDDEIYDRVDRLPERDYDDPQRPRAHPVLPPPSRRQTYYARPDPRAPRPAGQAPYYTQEAFGHHAYIEPRARPRMTPPPPPPPGHWGGYQLPPPQPYQRRPPRSPGPYDPRGQYRLPQPLYGYPATGYPPSPPYAPGPSGATVDPNIFKADPYWRHPGIPPSPSPDPGRSDVPLPSYVGPIRPNKQTKVAGKKKKKKKSTARVSQRVASAHISPSHSRNSVLVSSSALPQENLPKLAQRQDSGVVYPVSQDSDSPYQPIEVAADITSLMVCIFSALASYVNYLIAYLFAFRASRKSFLI
ncbi:hypothetical protein FRC09_004586 [Ceratobasidium sp. 395]|nr:hypothetical protein FRC09_004586 [Ceratobasidium sp. 395]